MADGQVEIEVVAKTELDEVEELSDLVEQIKEEASDGINLEVSGFDEAESSAEELSSQLESINDTVVAPEVDTSSIDEANAKIDETTSSMDNLTTAATGLAATAGFEQMAVTADNINTSWNRLELTFEGTGVSMDTLRDKTNELSNATGRSGGVVRDYFNQMGIAGVTNTDLISASFEALSGRAYQTGNSIESMEQKMQMMAMSGNASSRMLRNLGISAEDLAAAMGVSADEVSNAFKDLTPEERIRALTQAMGDGTEANEMYKNSYAGLKEQASAAMAGLMGAVGQAILPVIVPALQTATTFIKMLTDGFKALPGPVQAIIGGIGGFAAVVTASVGILGILGNVITTVKTGLTALRSIQLLNTIATQGAAAAQWLWNVAMSANPIGLLVIAIGILIAALAYLYFNNEQVRNTINNLASDLMNGLTSAINFISGLFTDFTNQLGLNTEDWRQAVLGFILFIPQLPLKVGTALVNTIAKALGFGNNFTSTMQNGAMNAVNGFINWIGQMAQRLQEEFNHMLEMAGQFALDIADRMSFGGASMVLGWISGSGEQSPGYMYDALIGELEAMVLAPLGILPGLVTNISESGYQMANALSQALLGVNIDEAVSNIINQLYGLYNAVVGVSDYILSLGGILPTDIQITGNAIIDTILRVLGFVATIPVTLATTFADVIARALGFKTNFVGQLSNAAQSAVNGFINYIRQLPNALMGELQRMIQMALDFATTFPSIIWNAAVKAVTSFGSGSGIQSPGYMYYMLKGEMGLLEDLPKNSKLPSNIEGMASKMVSGFNGGLGTDGLLNNSFGSSNSGVLASNETVINIYGDVDNDDRVRQIVDAVRRELAWNNATAGRTI